LVAVWFRPRLTWAVASAALIAFTLLAFYFIANRRSDQLAGKNAVEQPARSEKGGSERSTQAALPPASSDGGNQQLVVGIREPQRRKYRNALTDRAKSVAANSPKAESTVANVSPSTNNLTGPTLLTASGSTVSQKTLRVEIQTKDPNIRIIWFSQQETKPTAPNSKGI
jgi:hypothetical protein